MNTFIKQSKSNKTLIKKMIKKIIKKFGANKKMIVPLRRFYKKVLCENAKVAQLVEHDLAKVGVASSSLVFRST